MSFTVPVFPLVCAIMTGGVTVGLPRLTSPCNLAPGKRSISQWWPNAAGGEPACWICLLLPKLTDIRGFNDAGGQDAVECPIGTGRWYLVDLVDDFGKGFANEHRFALLQQMLPWPTPIP